MTNVSKPAISAARINEQIGRILNPTPMPYKSIVDGQGILHVFITKRDWLMFLDERDLELMARER